MNRSTGDGVAFHKSAAGLAALLLLTLGLRVVSALAADVMRYDSVAFIRSARQIEEGSLDGAFHYLGPNLYPVILLSLHKLGLEYELAGKLWGLAVSTLTLLPLVALARRQFGPTVGWITGFLYAVHPRFIEWGPELIRDPTFWFCFVMTLYLLQRAADAMKERSKNDFGHLLAFTLPSPGGRGIVRRSHFSVVPKIAWFLASGVAFALAVHLRTEGWLLVLPMLAVAVGKYRQSGPLRFKALAGRAAVFLGVPAVALCALNATVFRENPKWARLDYAYVAVHGQWLAAQNAWNGNAASTTLPAGRSASHQAVHYVKKLAKGFDPWMLLPLAVGMYRLRRRSRSLQQASQLTMSLLIFALVALYLAWYGEINTRYMLAGVIPFLPYAAYGLLVLVNKVRRLVLTRSARAVPKLALAGGGAVVLLVTGLLEGLDVNRQSPRQEAALGVWIRENIGEGAVLAGWKDLSYLQHYARGRGQIVFPAAQQQVWQPMLHEAQPDVVLVDPATDEGRAFEEYTLAHPELGYRLSSAAPNDVRTRRQVYAKSSPRLSGVQLLERK